MVLKKNFEYKVLFKKYFKTQKVSENVLNIWITSHYFFYDQNIFLDT